VGRLPDTRNVLRKDDTQAGFEMPIDMTVEEPWAWVVGAETEGDVVFTATNVQDISSYCPYDSKGVLDICQYIGNRQLCPQNPVDSPRASGRDARKPKMDLANEVLECEGAQLTFPPPASKSQ